MTNSTVGVDVRRPEELIDNPAPGSIHIEMGEVPTRFEKEFSDKSQEIMVFCEKGGRAEQVKEFLESKGYTKIKNIGSWREWNELQK